MNSKSNQNRIFVGVSYNTAIIVLDQLLRFFKGVILARLLFPAEFGIFGLALTVSLSLQAFSDFGLRTRFISVPLDDQAEEDRWLGSIWAVELIRGLLLCLVLMVSAPWFCRFFNETKLLPVIMLVSLVPIFSGLSSPGMYAYERKIQYKAIAIREAGASVGGFVLTICLAFLTKSAIALALGLLSQTIIGTILSYRLAPFRPKIFIDRKILLDCFHYGKHLFVIGLLTYVTTQVDNLFVGKLCGQETLGFYLVAYNLAMVPVALLGQIISRVALPFYSEAWNRGEVGLAYQRWRRSVAITTFLVALTTLGLWMSRAYLIPFVYGQRWVPATGVFAVLVFVGFFRGLANTISPMLLAMERPDVDAKGKTAEAFIFLSLLFVLIPAMGMVGAAYAGLVSYIVAFAFRFGFIIKKKKAEEVWALTKQYAMCGLCFVLTVAFMAVLQSYLRAVAGLGVAMIMFITINLGLNRTFREQLKEILCQRSMLLKVLHSAGLRIQP